MNVAALVVGAVVAGGALLGAAVLHVRRHPIETFVKMTRRSLARAGMTRHEIAAADSQRIVYFSGGSGERTLVLVHGVNDQAGSWSKVVPTLRKEFRVVAIDLPGHGESEPATGPLPMRMLIDGLAAVIDRESPGRPVVIVGNSMGGWVAMLYAAENPARVDRLVLEDASGMAWNLSHVPAFPKNREEALRMLRMVHGPDKPIPEYLVDAAIRLTPTLPQARVLEGGIGQWLIDARLPFVTMPVTLIWGEHDGLLPLDYAKALQSKIAGSKLEVIPGAAHVPHLQAPAEFTKLLLEAAR